MPTKPGDPRRTWAWQQLRQLVIAGSDPVCALCGRPVDITLPGTHRWGPSVDAIIPHVQGGSHTDPANLRLTHLRCNLALGGRQRRKVRPRVRSRNW